MTNGIVFASDVTPHLSIHPPTKPHESPSIVDLERLREISIDWIEIMSKSQEITQFKSVDDDIAGIKTYLHRRFAQSLGNVEAVYEIFFERLATEDEITDGEGFRLGTVSVNNPAKLDLSKPDTDNGAKETLTGFYFKHLSGRFYMPLFEGQAPIDKATLMSDCQSYAAMWSFIEKNCKGLEPVWEGKTQFEIAQELSYSRYISREAHLWTKMYFQLKERIKIGDTIQQLARGQVSEENPNFRLLMDDAFRGLSPDGKSLDNFLKTYTRFADVKTKAQSELNQLRSRIKAAGYTLCEPPPGTQPTADPYTATITHPYTQKPVTIYEGNIYRTSHRIVRWSTPYTAYVTRVRRGSSGRKKTTRRPVTRYKHHAVPHMHWELVDLSNDPVLSHIEALTNEDQTAPKEVHVMRQTDDGFVNQSGERLSNILELVDLDEDKRKSTVIVFPDYTPVISDIENYNGATFIYNPMPGIFAEQFPVISIQEDLGYKLQWTGTELGQLVGSLNLAPGEEREISVSTRFEEEVSETSTYKSAFTSERTATSEMSSEIASEASREFTKTKSSSSGASAGGSYGGFSAGASTKNSSTSTLKLFSKTMKKVARKASSSMSQKNSVEITSSLSKTTRVEQQNDRNTVIKNVNVGSTLNLLFYQINNRFAGGLYLNDLRIAIRSGKEVIAGTDIFETTVYPLSDLEGALEALGPDALPPIMARHIRAEDTTIDGREEAIMSRNRKYWMALIQALVDVLENEYCDKNTPRVNKALSIRDSNVTPVCTDASTKLLNIDGHDTFEAIYALSKPKDELSIEAMSLDDVGQVFENLQALLQQITLKEEALEPTDLIVASGGIWMESATGHGSALDEYSKQMRAIERSKAEEELKGIRQDNTFDRLRQINIIQSITDPAKLITITSQTLNDNTLTLALSAVVRHADFTVIIDGLEVAPLGIENQSGTNNLVITLAPNASFSNSSTILLISRTTDGVVILGR